MTRKKITTALLVLFFFGAVLTQVTAVRQTAIQTLSAMLSEERAARSRTDHGGSETTTAAGKAPDGSETTTVAGKGMSSREASTSETGGPDSSGSEREPSGAAGKDTSGETGVPAAALSSPTGKASGLTGTGKRATGPAPAEADFAGGQAPAAGPLLTRFGQGYSTTYEDYRFHPGIDIKAEPGAAIQTVLAGRVADISTDLQWGTVIEVDHGGGWTTRYGGCGKVCVEIAQAVAAGQKIAEVGEPGLAETADGPHLHFEVRKKGEPLDPIRLGIRLRER